jgi:hypothetical protein
VVINEAGLEWLSTGTSRTAYGRPPLDINQATPFFAPALSLPLSLPLSHAQVVVVSRCEFDSLK